MCDGEHTLSINSPVGNVPDFFIDTTRARGGEISYEQSDSTVTPLLCSNRGVCQETVGVCECYDFYESGDGVGGQGQRGDCGYYNPDFVVQEIVRETQTEQTDEIATLLRLLDPIGDDDLPSV